MTSCAYPSVFSSSIISLTQDICNLVLIEIVFDEMPVERRGNVNEKNGKKIVPKKVTHHRALMSEANKRLNIHQNRKFFEKIH